MFKKYSYVKGFTEDLCLKDVEKSFVNPIDSRRSSVLYWVSHKNTSQSGVLDLCPVARFSADCLEGQNI